VGIGANDAKNEGEFQHPLCLSRSDTPRGRKNSNSQQHSGSKCQQQRETTSRERRSLPIRKNAKSIYSRGPGARSILIAPCRILINCCCHHHCRRRGKEIAQWIKNNQQQHQRGGGIFSSLRGSAYKDCAAGEGDSSSPIVNKGENVSCINFSS